MGEGEGTFVGACMRVCVCVCVCVFSPFQALWGGSVKDPKEPGDPI